MHLQAAVEPIQKGAEGLRHNAEWHLSSLKWHAAGSLPLNGFCVKNSVTKLTWPLWGFHHGHWGLAFLYCERGRIDSCSGILLVWKVMPRPSCSIFCDCNLPSLTVRGLVAYILLQNFLHLKRWSYRQKTRNCNLWHAFTGTFTC